LQKRLKASSRINQKLDVIDENSGHAKQVLLRSDNKNESMTISLKDLLFVKSIDNYVEVHFLKNGKHTFSILRYSLSKVERDNDALRELIRCHRSYIANRLHIEKISGNAAGYKIKLKKYEQLIPVSRKWNGKIEELITSG
jgi:DNA-binding LytR/AlgR family response regulator